MSGGVLVQLQCGERKVGATLLLILPYQASLRRHGHWGTQTMEGAYLTSLPLPALRSMAGFAAEGKTFFLPRAGVEPPPSLQHKIFPEVEDWLEKMKKMRFNRTLLGKTS